MVTNAFGCDRRATHLCERASISYEMASGRVAQSRYFRAFGLSSGRLHTKAVVIDARRDAANRLPRSNPARISSRSSSTSATGLRRRVTRAISPIEAKA